MALQFTGNRNAKMASVVAIDWDNVVDKPPFDYVKFNEIQSLTDDQKELARSNIEAARAHWFNVKDYGATGDGTTDDATAIQAAVTAAFAEDTGGTVYFPAGTYIIGTQITWPKTSGKSVIGMGDGDASVVKNKSTLTSPIFYIGHASTAPGGSGVRLERIKFAGYDSSSARAIKCEHANITYFNRVTFEDFYIAVEMVSSFANRFTECSWNRINIYGVYSSTAAHNLIVDKCAFNDIGYSAATSAYGILLAAATDNAVITKCDFEFGYTAIQIAGGSSLKVSGNYIEYFSNTSIYSSATMNGAEISRNWIALGGNQLLDNFTNSDYVGNRHFDITVSIGTGTNIWWAGNAHTGTGSIPTQGSRRLFSSGTETTQFLTSRTLGIQNNTVAGSIVANQQIGSIGFLNVGSVAIAGVSAHYANNADGSSSYLTFRTGFVSDQAILDNSGNWNVKGQYRINGVQIAASNLSNGTTGSGAVVLATSPALTTPSLGAATATSINGLTVTTTVSGTLTLANNSSLVTSGANPITLTSTGTTNVTLPTSGTLATTTHSRQVLGGNTGGNITAGATQYFVTAVSNFESLARQIASVSGTFRNFYVSVNTAPGAGQTLTFTFRVNGADTGITCTISDAATSASDLVNTAAITAGQNWSVKVVSSAGAAVSVPSWGVQFSN